MVDAISGEAHWQLSVCENTIRLIKDAATKLARDLGESCTAEEAFGLAVAAHSELYRHHCYSPFMLLFGHEPSGMLSEILGDPEDNLELTSHEATDRAFQDRIQRRTLARLAWTRAEAEARLDRSRWHK
eukprot:3259012-Lingulodinium_polyedra.AAC.1